MPDLLFVCTGNVCRSPLAEALLRDRLRDVGVEVRSAGTHALVGAPMTPETAQLAARHGISPDDVAAHRARLLTPELLDGPDLVLALSREHRRAVVELAPRRLRSTFTVREFARLALVVSSDASARASLHGIEPGERLREAVALAGMARAHAPRPADEKDDDVVDPYRRPWEVYEHTGAQLVPAVETIASFVRALEVR